MNQSYTNEEFTTTGHRYLANQQLMIMSGHVV